MRGTRLLTAVQSGAVGRRRPAASHFSLTLIIQRLRNQVERSMLNRRSNTDSIAARSVSGMVLKRVFNMSFDTRTPLLRLRARRLR